MSIKKKIRACRYDIFADIGDCQYAAIADADINIGTPLKNIIHGGLTFERGLLLGGGLLPRLYSIIMSFT